MSGRESVLLGAGDVASVDADVGDDVGVDVVDAAAGVVAVVVAAADANVDAGCGEYVGAVDDDDAVVVGGLVPNGSLRKPLMAFVEH